MAAESAAAATILLASHFGYSLSTTHVATGSILGSGVGRQGAEVRWNVAGRMATAWLITLPASGGVGALAYYAANGIGGTTGVVVIFAALIVGAAGFYGASRKTAVTHHNVNAEWTGSVAPSETGWAAIAAA
jgi:PiT family inorganic phosphate transporter